MTHRERTYDENQAAAVLVRCWWCRRSYWMTHPYAICQQCRGLRRQGC